MKHRAWMVPALWCALLAAGSAWVHARLHISADLRLFMPTPRTEAQRLLVRNVGENPAARLLLVALGGRPPAELARLSRSLAAGLRAQPGFGLVANGEQGPPGVPHELLAYRYLITDSFDAAALDEARLAAALAERVEDLASPAGALVEEWIPRDPTLEVLHLTSRWEPRAEPRRIDDVWFSADGSRALLVLETHAAAFDPDAQQRALDAIHAEFARLRGGAPAQLTVSGSGFFAATIRERTQAEATWLGGAATLGMVLLMWLAYRDVRFTLLGALPLASGALAGLAAVGLLFQSVHGITLAFGFTLIGVAQDYPVHLFSHLRAGASPHDSARHVWPPLATGVASTCIAYLAFLFSGVTGLAQLACLTVTGLVVAALTTRFVLPLALGTPPRDAADSPLLRRIEARVDRLPRLGSLVLLITAAAVAVLLVRPGSGGFWQNDLSRLTPVPAALLRTDAALRAELGTPDLRHLLVVAGASADDVLAGLERLDARLDAAVRGGAIASYDHAALYLPSVATQRRRQAALPAPDAARAMLAGATAGLPFDAEVFEPFVADLTRARALPPLTPAGLQGTPLALRVSAGLFERDGRWYGLVSLHDVREPAQLAASASAAERVTFLDLKAAAEELVAAQRSKILLCLAIAAVLLVAVVWIALRRPARVLRVLAPMALTTLVIVAVLRACDVPLTLFHLISLVLAAGLGLDYALFFEHAEDDRAEHRRTLHAVIVCSLSTLLVFALLALSTVPVLEAIGVTVALGVISNFLLALCIARRRA
jgi:predicted exporter